MWIAHDPVFREFYFFSHAEKAIAISLDGIQSVNTIVQKCRRVDATISANFVKDLVRRLDQASLLLHRNWHHSKPAKMSLAGRWLMHTNSLIAWRVPLMNPTRLINALLPIGRILFSTAALYAVFAMGCGCLLMLAQQWTKLLADLATLQLGMRGDRLLLAGSFEEIGEPRFQAFVDAPQPGETGAGGEKRLAEAPLPRRHFRPARDEPAMVEAEEHRELVFVEAAKACS